VNHRLLRQGTPTNPRSRHLRQDVLRGPRKSLAMIKKDKGFADCPTESAAPCAIAAPIRTESEDHDDSALEPFVTQFFIMVALTSRLHPRLIKAASSLTRRFSFDRMSAFRERHILPESTRSDVMGACGEWNIRTGRRSPWGRSHGHYVEETMLKTLAVVLTMSVAAGEALAFNNASGLASGALVPVQDTLPVQLGPGTGGGRGPVVCRIVRIPGQGPTRVCERAFQRCRTVVIPGSGRGPQRVCD
jgi:hypothetical protein